MSPEVKRILYATDLSENAKYAFGYASDLANRYDAKLTVLSVIETMSPVADRHIQGTMGLEKWNKLNSEHASASEKKIRERMADICQNMDGTIDFCNEMVDDIRIQRGVPYIEILKTAKETAADMIVMGTHGFNFLQDHLIGGTARHIVKDSKIPVMVIRLPEMNN